MNRRPVVIAVIPAYDEEERIAKVVRQTKKYVDTVIVCDDGSGDNTGDMARLAGARVVRHRANMGYGAALSTLFRVARKLSPDVMVTLDADGQHDPTSIPTLVKPILGNKTDIVIGSRFLSEEGKGDLPVYRRVGINLITRLANRATNERITDAQSGLRAYSKKALMAIQPTEPGMGASTEILIKARQANLKVEETPVRIYYEGETSKENPITHTLGVILTTVKLASIRRPQIFYGMPALAALVVALGFWIRAGLIYSGTGEIEANFTFIALGATIISLILFVLAVILSILIRAVKEATTGKK